MEQISASGRFEQRGGFQLAYFFKKKKKNWKDKFNIPILTEAKMNWDRMQNTPSVESLHSPFGRLPSSEQN